MAKTVLVVEDDSNIAELLRLYLEKEGYRVLTAADGLKGVELFRTGEPDLVLLDIMLPGLDGWGVCRTIRQSSQVPIIMLTAKGETVDKVSGLKMGADDYITKPFEMKEVLARIEAVLRRGALPEESPRKRLVYDKLIIDLDSFELVVDGTSVTAALWTSTSSGCGKSWKAYPISGASRPSGAWAINSRPIHSENDLWPPVRPDCRSGAAVRSLSGGRLPGASEPLPDQRRPGIPEQQRPGRGGAGLRL